MFSRPQLASDRDAFLEQPNFLAPLEVFYSAFALVGFFLVLMLLSLLNFFERPMQEMIRSRWRAAEHHLDRHNDEIRASIETPTHGLGSAELVDTTARACRA